MVLRRQLLGDLVDPADVDEGSGDVWRDGLGGGVPSEHRAGLVHVS